MFIYLRLPALLLTPVLAIVATIAAVSPVAAQADATVVYLVRHAERAEDGSNDPPISEAGAVRARLLASILADAGVTHVHTTNYKRTRTTAAPTAEALAISVALYDPRDLEGFAAELASTPGRHLVLGHSNTTPALVEALGGDPGEPIDEVEYDRLYVVTLAEGTVSTVLLHYGEGTGG